MSQIEETLVAREHDFVTIRELVDGLVAEDGCTIQGAANWLLHKGICLASGPVPYFFAGAERTTELNGAILNALTIVADTGKYLAPSQRGLLWVDDRGWLRVELKQFLANAGIDASTCLPPADIESRRARRSTGKLFWMGEQFMSKTQWTPFHPDDDHYPKELDIAVQAWRAVSNDPKSKPTIKQQLKQWVKTAYKDTKDEAVERIATIANWEKSGGRVKSEGEAPTEKAIPPQRRPVRARNSAIKRKS